MMLNSIFLNWEVPGTRKPNNGFDGFIYGSPENGAPWLLKALLCCLDDSLDVDEMISPLWN